MVNCPTYHFRKGLVAFLAALLLSFSGYSQISITGLSTPYTQDFNGLSNSTASSTVPTGWAFIETGTGSNTTYSVGTGSSNTGDTYSAGSSSSTDRAFGSLQSGSVLTKIGASFTNNTGSTINELTITYTGEQWRFGATGRVDRMDFMYSLDATTVNNGTWTDVNTLDFSGPASPGSAGALDGNANANRTVLTTTITGLSIASGATFFIRWVDVDATSSDDLLAIDDFSISAASGSTTITTGTISGSPFNTTCAAGVSVDVPFTSVGTFTGGNVYTAQLSSSTGSFTSPTTIGTLTSTANSGTITATIPMATTAGTAYRIRVVSNSPSVIGTDNGTNLTITYTCSIATGTITGSPFNTTCSAGASVSVPFTASSSFGTGNVYTAQLSNSTGSFASPTTIGTLTSSAATGTISATIPMATAAGTGYRIRVIGSVPSITGSDNGSNLTITYTCSITTGAITGSPFTTSCTAGASVSVPFTSSSAFGATNVYTAQLSSSTGSFASPVNIGTLTSTATSGTISATLPTGTASGTAYRIRVVGSSPSITGSDNGSNLTVNYSCAALVINEVYIDAISNDGSPNPDLGEWIELYNSTGAAVDLSCWSICDGDFCVTFPSGSTIADGGYFTIGSAAGSGCATCDFPGATYNVDWSTCSCTSGNTIGTLTNSAEQVVLFNPSGNVIDAVIWGGGQSLPTTMSTATTGSCSSNSVTLPSGASNYENIGIPSNGQSHERVTDGSLTWQLTSSPTLGGTNAPPLPVELISFTAKAEAKGNVLEWVTATELNNEYFEISRSFDGESFTAIAKVDGHGTTSSVHHYSYTDNGSQSIANMIYYSLRQYDFDGKMSSGNIITVKPKNNISFNVFATENTIQLNLTDVLPYSVTVKIVSVTGEVINETTLPEGSDVMSIKVPASAGIYFIGLYSGSDVMTRKVVVQ
jgi:hypothetical protein